MRDITPVVAPRSVAVIGASANTQKSGGILFKNLVDGGFAGPLHPINPRAAEVMGRTAYPSITAAPGPIDLVYIVLPKAGVRGALVDCIAARARAACIITAGFSEIGAPGRREQDELRDLVRAGHLLTIGPNTIGSVNAGCKLMGSFVPFPSWQSGGISIFAQTGIFAGAAMVQLMAQESQRLGIGTSVDVGNKIDVDELDFLRFVAGDPATTVIGFYVEDLRDPPAFLELAAQVKRDKPIVVLKPGRTPAGAAASAFHTGSIAMDDAALDAALRRAGIVRADDVDDFLGYLKAFSYLPRPRGNRVGVVTGSGALGVMAADELTTAGLAPAELSRPTLAAIGKVVPDWQPLANPVDTWIAVDVAGPRASVEVPFEAMLGDPGVDVVLGLPLTPPNADFPEVREVFAGLRARHPDVPLVMVLTGGSARERWLGEIEGLGIAVYPTTRAAVRALRAITWYAEQREIRA
jgi:acyl-CoA synthetase (NDP forming)